MLFEKLRAFTIFTFLRKKMLIPPFLEEGDTIGLIAPSRSGDEKMITAFVEEAESRKFKVLRGSCLVGTEGQFAATDDKRVADLAAVWNHSEVKALVAVRGGYGAVRLLEGLPLGLMRQKPKWLAGFSDITALHSAVNRYAGLQSLHTWMPVSLTQDPRIDLTTVDSLFSVLKGNLPVYNLPAHPMNSNGKASGILTGGNLSVLYSLAGTKWEPDYRDKILFLEDLDEYLYHIDRMCMNLELRGIFGQIRGLVVGSMTDMHDNTVPFGQSAEQIISAYARKYRIPVLFGFPSGHSSYNNTLIFGRHVTLSVGEAGSSLDFRDLP